MPGVKTNEVPGTRAVLRHYRMSAYKARQVLDLVRGEDVDRAEEILHTTPRDGARVVAKVLASAVANARNNDQLEREELYVSACFADEGTTLKRWRPRARGRATRIRKRSCHITVIVSRLPEDRLERKRARLAAATGAMRSRRVAASRREARRGRGEEETVPAADGAAGENLAATEEEASAEEVRAEDELDPQEPGEPVGAEGGDGEAVVDEATSVEEVEVAAEKSEPAESVAAAEQATTPEEDGTEGGAAPAARARKAPAAKTTKKATKATKKTTKKAQSEADDTGDGAQSDEDGEG